MKNNVFIATSLDGYIADKNGSIDWLYSIPNPNSIDMGYNNFISNMDAIIMGKNTFEIVCSFDIDWPYKIPVFVLSNSLKQVSEKLSEKVQIVNGKLTEILKNIHHQEFYNLYIDGGEVIQSFLKEDLIDEMIITTIPILLGGGVPLFSELDKRIEYTCVETKLYLDAVVQNRFVRKRN